jgi:hypothetical protein
MRDAPDVEMFHARDAYSAGILLSCIVLITQLSLLVTLGSSPQGLSFPLRCALLVGSFVALGFLLATRHRPRERAAWAVCATLMGTFLLLIPWTAMRWRDLGRPWEAFLAPQIAMITLALTVPRSFWLGIVAVLAFLLEGLCILASFVSVGTPRQSLPVAEPGVMILYAIVGVAIVVARHQRRTLCLRHVRSEAEAATLTRLSSFLHEIIDEMSSSLVVLSDGLARIATAETRQMERGAAAIARLIAVRAQLARLVRHPTEQEGSARTPPTEPGPVREVALTDGEREFYARDAYQSARIVAIMMLAAMVVAVHAARQRSQLLQLLWGGHAVVVAICLAILQRTWATPSERRGIVVYMVVALPLLVIFVYAQPQWALGTQAFEPLTATKLLMLVLALAAPRHRWLSLAMVALIAAEGIAIFYGCHFDRLRDRIPMREPWPLLLHLLIAAALLTMREQRRVASVRLLRADREMAAQARHAGFVLALLDQVCSPLQVLMSTTATVFEQQPDARERDALERALRRLASIPGRVPQIDLRAYDYVGLSPDGHLT